MTAKILLIDDVDDLGRSGDIVSVRPGFFRNYLEPKGLAVKASKGALLRQKRLQEERKKKAIADRSEAEQLAKQIEGQLLTIKVKVDQEGHMYGSVSALDLVHLLENTLKVKVEKRQVAIPHAIKDLGTHTIPLKLQEDVATSFSIKVISETDAE